jgi:HSP20 family protein
MLITRGNPAARSWGEVRRLRDDMNRMFASFNQQWPGLSSGYPGLNVWQDADNLYAEAELPGIDLSDLEIFVTGGDQLSIKGARKPVDAKEGVVWLRRERPFGRFARLLTLPVDVDANKVQARLVNGVLTLTLPKSEAAKPKKIAVKAE